MLHELLKTWFVWVEQWGYWGVFVLMALESSIVPVPSEIVMPPAAFWAAQGRMSFWGVVMAGTAGSLFGSLASYYLARWAGLPVVKRYGKYFFLSPEKVKAAENWVVNFGVAGVFFARLLPVVRHLISIPAGIFRMRVVPFSIVTTVGAFAWCTVLSWFGMRVIGDRPELLESPEQMVAVMKERLHLVVAGVVVFAILYAVMTKLRSRMAKKPEPAAPSA